MTLVLGVDTGGSFTDAVVYDDRRQRVLAAAKQPTTHDQLAIGVGDAVAAVLAQNAVNAETIELVCLSTTLATNALVEDKGRRAALILIGFDASVIERGGLGRAIGDAVVVHASGGHTSHGHEREPLDVEQLAASVADIGDRVDAVAITAQFSVRNPAHETAARDLVRSATGLPVTCSHELSSTLNGPKRALTALLNARLIALIDDLMNAADQILVAQGITAPVMVVRGNGSLVPAAFVRERPIETIMSGPAASLLGAGHLTSSTDGLIADIGGTTTDIAVLVDGRPQLRADGALVGGHETMVEAIRVHTHGIGGDSEVRTVDGPGGTTIAVGPRRVVPISVAAEHHPDAVGRMLRRQLSAGVPGADDGRIAITTRHAREARHLSAAERGLVAAVDGAAVAVTELADTSVKQRALARLVSRGLIQLAGLTPTDACLVLGLMRGPGADVASDAATLVARRSDNRGSPIAASGRELCERVIDALVRQSAEALLDAAMERDGIAADPASAAIVEAALSGRAQSTRLDIGVSVPIVGLGAPAPTYYPRIAELLGTAAVVPENVAVANAIGAAVAPIRSQTVITVTAPRRGTFRVHGPDELHTVHDLDEARRVASDTAHRVAENEAATAGADVATLLTEVTWDENSVLIDGRPLFIEAVATAVSTGRPALNALAGSPEPAAAADTTDS